MSDDLSLSATLKGSHSDGDVVVNRSANPSFNSIVEQRYSRRMMMFGGMTATAAAMFGLAACDSGSDAPSTGGPTPPSAAISAGGSGTITSGRMVTLTGSNAGTPGGWTQISGPSVVLTQVSPTVARFEAPSVAAPTALTFTFQDNQTGLAASAVVNVNPAVLGFSAVAKSLEDIVTVPAGYTVTTLYRLGDPLDAATSAYANDGTDSSYAMRAGDHHDGMYYFGLGASGGRDDNSNTRGLLAINHENITQRYLHPNGATPGTPRIEAEARKEIEAHGVAVVEVLRGASGWSYVQNSPLNRRINPFTPMAINGPAAGAQTMRTAFSPTGVAGRGTVNNCAHGYAPWGTYLTCEENWAGYFRRQAGDNALRPAKDAAAFSRYGVGVGVTGGYGWGTVVPADASDTRYAKFDASVQAAAAPDGTGDFRFEPNQFGWVVEIDPYDPASTPRKRTALGRMAHEGAWPANFAAGRRPVYYMGDDSRGEYFYKFVSATPWDPADAQRADRLAVGDKYLDAGTLYAARFDATGAGIWLPLVFGQGNLTAANPAYAFESQAEVLINTRLAADAQGATKMDRPEWGAVNPENGEVYLTLTNGNATSRPLSGTDAANPRHYNDPRGATNQRGNPNGHIIRLREAGDNPEATNFAWDIYAFGAGADLDPANINLSGLDATNDFSSPDGLWFSRPTNAGGRVNPLLWIQTDDGAYADVTNCMMLAAMPGRVGDGAARTIVNTDVSTGATAQQATIVGRAPGMTLRRFLVGPKECEITGIDSTPDGRTIFVNIQHPGEDTRDGFPNTFPSNWPASQTNPAAVSRPRSSTIVITKDDGGIVGL